LLRSVCICASCIALLTLGAIDTERGLPHCAVFCNPINNTPTSRLSILRHLGASLLVPVPRPRPSLGKSTRGTGLYDPDQTVTGAANEGAKLSTISNGCFRRIPSSSRFSIQIGKAGECCQQRGQRATICGTVHDEWHHWIIQSSRPGDARWSSQSSGDHQYSEGKFHLEDFPTKNRWF
jgi:hypothetical protein